MRPLDNLAIDQAGNLYGTTYCDGANNIGNVFKLFPAGSGWTYTSLHDFSGPDGSSPISDVTLDSYGNLYGTTSRGEPMVSESCGRLRLRGRMTQRSTALTAYCRNISIAQVRTLVPKNLWFCAACKPLLCTHKIMHLRHTNSSG